jgi:hypothetical protein
MANGEKGMVHAAPSSRLAESAAFVGRDVVGLVTFDFVLRVIFRAVMDVTLVVEIAGVDGDNSSRNAAGLGIPTDVIADLKAFRHTVLRAGRLGTTALNLRLRKRVVNGVLVSFAPACLAERRLLL